VSDRQDAPLMLAYLGYQTGADELTQYGLDYAQARQPNDTLLMLLRQIWLKGAPTTQPAPLKKQQPASEDAPADGVEK